MKDMRRKYVNSAGRYVPKRDACYGLLWNVKTGRGQVFARIMHGEQKGWTTDLYINNLYVMQK